jgi:hypothetical protein
VVARACAAELRPGFGHVRCWNFRKDTGFTALGIRPATGPEAGAAGGVNGVVFPVDEHMSAIDARELGYDRVRVPPAQLSVLPPPAAGAEGLLGSAAEACYHYNPYLSPLELHCERYGLYCMRGGGGGVDAAAGGRRGPALDLRPGGGLHGRGGRGAPDLPDLRRHGAEPGNIIIITAPRIVKLS